MSHPERSEILVLGTGEGGKYLAWHMTQSGHRTAVVERRWIGGSCPNINRLPSKNEIWSARVVDLVHHAPKFGMVTDSAAILAGLPYTSLRDAILRHPSMAEGLGSLFANVPPHAFPERSS